MTYITVFVLLSLVAWAYLIIADKLNIIDQPNDRSSHNYITVRGAGILFPVSVLFYLLFDQFSYNYFIIGLLLIGLVSFWDDVKGVRNILRFLVHLIAVTLIYVDVNLFTYSIPLLLLAYVLTIGWINAFNFMDGINGITVFYGAAILIPLWILADDSSFLGLIQIIMLSLIIFGFQNVRKRALAFCGDVGSVTLAYILAFLLICFMHRDQTFLYILILSVYGVDSVLTIFHRLFKKENIFQAHRSHLYQDMTSRLGYSHIFVSAIYGIVQLIISIITIYFIAPLSPAFQWLFGIFILLSLTLFYIIYKQKIEQATAL